MTHAPFDANDHEAFTDWLRANADPHWDDAVGHRFVRELAADTLDDAVFRRYLVQDYAFLDTLTRLVAHAAGHAPTMTARRELAAFLGTLTSDEDDYFGRAFDTLDVPEDDRRDPTVTATTAAFEDLLARAAHEGGYATALAALLPVEWVYLEWASDVAALPDRFYLAEWIDLHTGPDFEAVIAFLREELDALGPTLPVRDQARVARHFARAVELEVAFFDDAYA